MRNYKTIGDINDIKGFFEKYSEIKPDNFNELFEKATSADIQTMDYILSDLYGSKVLLSKYADMFDSSGADVTMQRIVLIADKICFENWKAIKENIKRALTQDNEKPLKSVKTVSSEKTGENATENKVNAFDSEEALDSDNSSHNYTDNIETTETTSYSNGKTASENAEKFIDFANNNDFIENIIKDVLNVSCIDVFDDNYVGSRSSGSSGGSGDIEDLKNRIEEIESVIPENATPQNKLATMSDVQSGYDDTELRVEINGIKSVIPPTAGSSNKLTTKSELQAVESSIPDVTGLATKSELQAVESSIPDVTGLATKSELQAVESSIPDVTGLATKSELQAVESSIPDVTGLATKSELQAVESSIPDVTGLATKSELQAVESSIPDVTGLATKSELQAVESSIPDVTGLATKSEVQAITDLIPSNASTTNTLATMADIGGGGSSGSDVPWIKKTFSVSGITHGRFSINVLLGSGTDENGNYYLGYDSTEYTSSDFPEVEVIMWGVNYPIIRQVDTTVNGMGGMQLSFLLLDNTGGVASVASASGMIVARKRTMAT